MVYWNKANGYVSLPSNQTSNKYFLRCLSGSINVADLFVFAGTNWENPVPESDTKIIIVTKCFFFFFFFFFFSKHSAL